MSPRTTCIALSTLMVVMSVATPPLRAQTAALDAATIQRLKTDLEAAKRSVRDADLNLQKARADLAQLKAASTQLQTVVVQREQAIVKLQGEANVLRNEAIAQAQRARAVSDRNMQLQAELAAALKRLAIADPIIRKLAEEPADPKQVAEILAQFAELKRKVDALVPEVKDPNAPDKMLKGKVSRIDPDDLLTVTINLGTEHGLKVNNVMELFRTTPVPKYVGRVRIISVSANSAVARLIVPNGLTASAIEVDDRVWSYLPR